MKNPVDGQSPSSNARRSGRPAKPDAKSPAQRAKDCRERKKVDGLKAVKCYLPAETLSYLNALCKIHDVTISDAISMVLTAVIRGESLPLR